MGLEIGQRSVKVSVLVTVCPAWTDPKSAAPSTTKRVLGKGLSLAVAPEMSVVPPFVSLRDKRVIVERADTGLTDQGIAADSEVLHGGGRIDKRKKMNSSPSESAGPTDLSANALFILIY